MIVTYTPEDGDRAQWEFAPRKVRQSKAEMIEKRAGCTWTEWQMNIKAGQALALKVLLWHLMGLAHPHLRIEDVPDFAMGEIAVELDLGELLETRAEVEKSPAFTPAERDASLSLLDGEIEDRMARGEVEPGKALSRSGGSSTGSPSPQASA